MPRARGRPGCLHLHIPALLVLLDRRELDLQPGRGQRSLYPRSGRVSELQVSLEGSPLCCRSNSWAEWCCFAGSSENCGTACSLVPSVFMPAQNWELFSLKTSPGLPEVTLILFCFHNEGRNGNLYFLFFSSLFSYLFSLFSCLFSFVFPFSGVIKPRHGLRSFYFSFLVLTQKKSGRNIGQAPDSLM